MYDEIKVLSLSPTSVTVPANGTAEATLIVGCEGNCGITVKGTGDTGNGIFADIRLIGGASKTATLNESNSYLVTWSGFSCGKSYTVQVTKAGEKKNGSETSTKITTTVNPSGEFTLSSGMKQVTVNFKKPCATLKWKIINNMPKGSANERIQTITLGLNTNDGGMVSINTGGGFASGEFREGSICLPQSNYPLTYGKVLTFNDNSTAPIIVTAKPNPIGRLVSTNSADVTFTITSPAKTVYTLTVKYQEEGTNKQLFPDNTYQMEAGYKQVIMPLTPPEGYKIGKNTHTNTVETAIAPFTMPNKDYTIIFYYTNDAIKTCKVTIQSATGGKTTPAGTQTVECGKAMSIKATASSGYMFKTWSKTKGNGTFANAKNGSTTFTPTSDATITPSFEEDKRLTVTLAVDAYSSVKALCPDINGWHVHFLVSKDEANFGEYFDENIYVGETRTIKLPAGVTSYTIQEGMCYDAEGNVGGCTEYPANFEYFNDSTTYKAWITSPLPGNGSCRGDW